jgi:hypothetical protein
LTTHTISPDENVLFRNVGSDPQYHDAI